VLLSSKKHEKYTFPNPYFTLDDNSLKRDYENRVGIGYSVVGAIIASGIFLKSKTVVSIGYGPVGQGLAEFSKGIGAKVIIVDIDPQKRILAKKRRSAKDERWSNASQC
jgi:adenosylhomocysteinase